MRSSKRVLAVLGVALAWLVNVGSLSGATHLMENLGRGVVAVRTSSSEAFVSWRMLGTDPDDVAFNLYRSTGGGPAVLLNASPLTGGTNYNDATADLTQANAYFVRPVLGGVEQADSATFTLAADAPVQQYLRVPLSQPAPGAGYTYSPNDCSVGDVDGDGEYEIFVKWDPSNAQDNSNGGVTGNVFIDAYKLDGTFLWRIDLGRNIRAGAHYTQFLVYDFDGDGKAELVCKTAPNTKDGTGTYIGQPGRFLGTPSAPIDHNADYRNANGYVLTGPEFFTIFNGQTGAEMVTTNYVVPRNNNPASGDVTAWGDDYGNRVDRFLACVAYLDGRRPSFVLCRGYYTRAVLAAWDWRDGQLTQRWVFDTGNTGTVSPIANWRGQGSHSLTVGDVDGDGRDEITYGAAGIDDDGTGLYSTLLGHGDALHMSDMDPNRPGEEVWMVHEDPGSYGPTGLELRDARTGALIYGLSGQGADVGRGCAGDIDPRYLGYEMWGTRGGLVNAQVGTISATHPNQINFMVYWDGDLLREILDNTTISKWDWNTSTSNSLLAPSGIASNNGTKATPNLSADILGDWREEVIWRESTNDALRIYTTVAPTSHRIRTLMHDRQYRLAIAWQNVAYNQPPHPSFYLGDGMTFPPAPDIVTSLGALPAVAPAMVSSDRYDPFTAGTGATSVIFRVTFNTPVTGVDAADFTVNTTGSVVGTVSNVTALSSVAYNVTVSSITGTGTIRLDLAASGTGITGPGGVPVAGGFTTGQVYNRATLAWTKQTTGGLWSDAANWDGGVIADGVGAVPIFGNFDLLANNSVLLDTPRTISGLTFGDTGTATSASWSIDDNGDPANVLTFDTVSGVPVATVNALGSGATATLNLVVAGSDGFSKAGAGTLVLTKPEALSGQVNVTAGTLRIATGGLVTASTVAISAGGGTLDINGGAFTATGNTTVNGNGGSLIVNAGTGTFAAVATNNTTSGLIRVNGGTFTASSINLPRSSDGTPSFGFGFVVTGGTANVNGTIGIGTNNSWGSMSIEGGATTVTGGITLANQSSANRGGQLRVTGGSLTSTNAAEGLVMVRNNTTNVATASFLGGTATFERIALGFNSTVATGSATLTVNGGTLYLGSGGLVRNGTGAFASTVNLQSGTLGAKANWSTTHALVLPSGGNIQIKAADAANAPFDITLSGPITGAGGLTKTGAGTLTLAGTNTYTGATTINAGTLRVSGNTPGAISLANAGALAFSGVTGAAPFNAASLTWSGGGALVVRTEASGVSDRLAVSGAFTRAGTGPVVVNFVPGTGFAAGNTYTLATFGSTTFTAADFVATGLPAGYAAQFTLGANSLTATIVATPVITSDSSASGTYNAAFNYTITATNGPTSYNAIGLPANLTVDTGTGVISGTPAAAGTYDVTLEASNFAGTGAAPLTLTIAKALSPVVLTNLRQAYDGSPKAPAASTTPPELSVDLTYDGSAATPTLPGNYGLMATINDPNYSGMSSDTFAISITGLVRHAPTLSGDVDGSLQVLLPESITLATTSVIGGGLLAPGTPSVVLSSSAVLGATIDHNGAATPTSHTVTLNGNAMLGHLGRRVDALAMPVVAPPPAPAGTRNVSMNSASQSPGDFATLRNLTLSGSAGMVAVPSGTYGNFSASGNSGFILGVAGSTEPAVYNLQNLSVGGLPGGAPKLQVVGPVI
ncbi:MAG TPA: MBG domain-containing protein, partial [Lacunisphaera sp.]|nr:MBG domain-containing protein [Lacunisphaera sp.]